LLQDNLYQVVNPMVGMTPEYTYSPSRQYRLHLDSGAASIAAEHEDEIFPKRSCARRLDC